MRAESHRCLSAVCANRQEVGSSFGVRVKRDVSAFVGTGRQTAPMSEEQAGDAAEARNSTGFLVASLLAIVLAAGIVWLVVAAISS